MSAIIFTGGGTTGHVTKNLIVMDALRKHKSDLEYHYLGSKKGKEKKLVTADIAHFHPINSGKLRRYFSLQTIPDFFRFLWGIWDAFWLLGEIKPKLVFSSGGYVALPVAFAAWLRRVPVMTHETDSYPGLANRMIGKVAKKIFLGFSTAESYFDPAKVIYTGNPISPALLAGSKERALKQLKFTADKPIILFMGGSQGAQQINELVGEILSELVKNFQVIHLTGKGKASEFSEETQNYVSFEYITNEYADFLNTADLIVTRGGGNSLTEVAALNKKAVIIPLLSAAGDHQRKNALEMSKDRPAWQVLDEENLAAPDLLKAITELSKKETKDESDRNKDREQAEELIIAEMWDYL